MKPMEERVNYLVTITVYHKDWKSETHKFGARTKRNALLLAGTYLTPKEATCACIVVLKNDITKS